MTLRWQESALSEIIGFILILAIITAVASLYVTYTVPAQGREGEIYHMEYIRDQFTDYKVSVDSLWVNNRQDVTMSTSINLGTAGGKTSGSILNVPFFQPIGSGGVMVVNGRHDTVTYVIENAITDGFPGNYTPNFTQLQSMPQHMYINFRTSNPTLGGGVLLKPDKGNWSVWLDVTKTVNDINSNGTIGIVPTMTYSSTGSNERFDNILAYINRYIPNMSGSISGSSSNDLSITLVKNGNTTVSNWVIYRNITNNRDYTVDLFDEAYGLSSNDQSYPFTLLRNNQPLTGVVVDTTYPWLDTRYPLSNGYTSSNIVIPARQMGSLEYFSNNYYWIEQNYYYQSGGVFLEQIDGAIPKLALPITLSKTSSGDLNVQITDITIISTPQSQGGSNPVELSYYILSQSEGRTGCVTFAQGIPNAKKITISINADDPSSAYAWESAFRKVRTTANQSGVPLEWTTITADTSTKRTFTINGPSGTENHLILDYIRVNLSTSLQSAAF
jgi:hypothetical protein